LHAIHMNCPTSDYDGATLEPCHTQSLSKSKQQGTMVLVQGGG
jgi:hypothetical protein